MSENIMRKEILEQSEALRKTIESESDKIHEISHKLKEYERFYFVGCGSSLSTLLTINSLLDYLKFEKIRGVYTGFEFYYNPPYVDENTAIILCSQSGETRDTVYAARRAKQENIYCYTIGITNEEQSSLATIVDDAIITRAGKEQAIVATKTYVTQLFVLYSLFLPREVNEKLQELPTIYQSLISKTEEGCKQLAKKFRDTQGFYVVASGVNYGLAYKVAMTMLMEGCYLHGCPVYAGEFRHGLIEKVEKGVDVMFLRSGLASDKITNKALEFCERIGARTLVFDANEYYKYDSIFGPFILIIPLEWFIYYLALERGVDPAATRHIGKVRY